MWLWARRKRSVAGSRATTEGLFEAFAFDVCPTTQRDLFLWAAGSALVCGKHHFSAALSFPITFKLQLTTNFGFFFFLTLPVNRWQLGKNRCQTLFTRMPFFKD